MASKAVKSVAKYVGSYARAIAERHEQLLQKRLQDHSLTARIGRFLNTGYHRQLGLVDDDQLYGTYRDHVREGLSRLPREEQEMRVFRNLVAAHLDAKHEILPKGEQVTEATNRSYAILYVQDAADEMRAKLYWRNQ